MIIKSLLSRTPAAPVAVHAPARTMCCGRGHLRVHPCLPERRLLLRLSHAPHRLVQCSTSARLSLVLSSNPQSQIMSTGGRLPPQACARPLLSACAGPSHPGRLHRSRRSRGPCAGTEGASAGSLLALRVSSMPSFPGDMGGSWPGSSPALRFCIDISRGPNHTRKSVPVTCPPASGAQRM